MTESRDEDKDDEPPWASPEIRTNYEAALGRFILAFNEVDNLLTEVIETVLERLGRQDLNQRCTGRDYALKCLVLDLLKTSAQGDGIADVKVDLLRQLGGERNILAHGHFDQNPFDGTYDVIVRNVRAQYSVERLDGLTELAEAATLALRYASAFYAFDEIPGPQPKS